MRLPLLAAALAFVFASLAPAQGFGFSVYCEDGGWENHYDWVDTVRLWPSSLGEDYVAYISDDDGLLDVVPVSCTLTDPIIWQPSHNPRGRIVSSAVGAAGSDDVDAICTLDCFAGNTFVATPSGLTPIASLRAGDVVLDENGRAVAVAALVTSRAAELVTITLEGEEIRATTRHPFLTQRGWVAARDLCLGDAIVGADGDSVCIVGLNLVELAAPCVVYQLVLESGDSFAVGHAKCVTASSERRFVRR